MSSIERGLPSTTQVNGRDASLPSYLRALDGRVPRSLLGSQSTLATARIPTPPPAYDAALKTAKASLSDVVSSATSRIEPRTDLYIANHPAFPAVVCSAVLLRRRIPGAARTAQYACACGILAFLRVLSDFCVRGCACCLSSVFLSPLRRGLRLLRPFLYILGFAGHRAGLENIALIDTRKLHAVKCAWCILLTRDEK